MQGLKITAICMVAVAAMLVAGCGSSNKLPAYASASPTATTLKIAKVVNDTYGFEMAYPYGWVGTHFENPETGGAAGATLKYFIAFADPDGSKGNGSYLDSVQVAVYELDRAVQPKELTPAIASRLAVDVILKDMESLSPRGTQEGPYPRGPRLSRHLSV